MREDIQDPMSGVMISGYRVVRLIAKGAMGLIYQAEHPSSGQVVAIKFLSGEYSSKPDFVRRFQHEAKTCFDLRHPNVMRVFAMGEHDGLHYMVMEFVDGVDLTHFIQTQDKIKESKALEWMQQAAEGLAYAHQHQVVHRDLKPGNIMLTKSGAIKIADLGLSKTLGKPDQMSMTLSGTVIGTPYYISPEQARDAKHVDLRTDIYSLGATFYHLLTGRPPFNGASSAEVMAKHMNETVVPPQRINHALSDRLGDMIVKMMEKSAENRYQNMQEVKDAIQRVHRGESAVLRKIKVQSLPEAEESRVTPAQRVFSWFHQPWLQWSTAIVGLLFFLFIVATTFLKPISTHQKIKGEKPPIKSVSHPSRPVGNVMRTTSELKEDEELVVSFGKNPGMPSVKGIHWLDLLVLLPLFFGILGVQQVGWFWGSVRAIGVAGAVGLSGGCFGEMAKWLISNLSIPKDGARGIAFVVMSVVLIFVVWVLTHRIKGYEKDTWGSKLDRLISTLPGILLGSALAVWIFVLLILFADPEIPARKTWMGITASQWFTDLSK